MLEGMYLGEGIVISSWDLFVSGDIEDSRVSVDR